MVVVFTVGGNEIQNGQTAMRLAVPVVSVILYPYFHGVVRHINNTSHTNTLPLSKSPGQLVTGHTAKLPRVFSTIQYAHHNHNYCGIELTTLSTFYKWPTKRHASQVLS